MEHNSSEANIELLKSKNNTFKDYIESPIEYGPFDIILIDGRARVSCSSICKLLSHENTIIFIHDFHRPEYQEALKYLELIDSVKTMSKFKLKK